MVSHKGEKLMKINPKLRYFIEENIQPSRTNPYILSNAEDLETCRSLIKGSGLSKQKEERTFNFLKDLEFPTFSQVKVLLNRIQYNLKDAGRIRVRTAYEELFPNWEELEKANAIRRNMQSIVSLKENIQENLLLIEEKN